MLNQETKRRIDSARDILVGKVPDPKAQVEQITTALIYKFMDDMDKESEELGGKARFFVNEYEKYSWSKLLDTRLGGFERLNLYVEALLKMPQNSNLPQLFRNILKDAFLPYRDPETLNLFLKEINGFTYDHSEKLGDAYEYLLSVLGSQGDAGQFRTPRHIIDFIVEVVDPKKDDTILDPACGTAGFLISSYKHILKQNTVHRLGDQLTPEEKTSLMNHFMGYDIAPEMVRLSLVNMYLHNFPNPNIFEYDTLTNEERWNDTYDVIMANPPFMSPKGGIRPHKRFSIQANRSEVLFVDYIAEHLTTHGRAGVIVPEGIIFQSGNAYKALRKMLVEKYLFAVVSLPAGVFQPYSGVKTSILFMDKQLAKKSDSILFVKVENDGFDLGAQRRAIEKNDLTEALCILQRYKQALQENRATGNVLDSKSTTRAIIVEKVKIAKLGDYNFSGDRYRAVTSVANHIWPMVYIGEVCEFKNGLWKGKNPPYEKVKILRNTNFTKDGRLNFDDVAEHDVEINQLETRLMEYGDIILEKSGGGPSQPVGRVALFGLTDGKYSYSNFTARIRVTDKRIEPIFLWIMLNNLYQKGATTLLQNQTSGIRNLDLTAYRELKIPIPPLVIQQEVIEDVNNYQKIIDGAKAIAENWQPSFKIDADWEKVKLGDKILLISGQHIDHDKYSRTDIGTPYITGPADYGKYYPIITKWTDVPKVLAKKNDVLITVKGSGIGSLNILDIDIACISRQIMAIRAVEIDMLYMYFFLRNKYDYFQDKGTGAAIPGLSRSDLLDLIIPFPSIEIQKQIAEKIEFERALVNSAEKLVEIFEQKIKDKIAEVWGE